VPKSAYSLLLPLWLIQAHVNNWAAPHLHVTVKPRRWWDDQFANVGCTPDLGLLAFFWRDARSLHPTHFMWEPYREPWIFAYDCPKPLSPAQAVATLASMRTVPLRPQPVAGGGRSIGATGDVPTCSAAHGWCGIYPSTSSTSFQLASPSPVRVIGAGSTPARRCSALRDAILGPAPSCIQPLPSVRRCDVFHPSVYNYTEEDLAFLNGGADREKRTQAPVGGWLRERHADLHELCLGCPHDPNHCGFVCASFA
jgi:hypothetical protein